MTANEMMQGLKRMIPGDERSPDGITPSIVTAGQIRPRPERLLVRRLKKAEKTAGGILLPESAQEISQMGIVLAAGEKTTLAVDDWIIFSAYAATPCVATSDYSDELLFVREQDVLAVVEDDPAPPSPWQTTGDVYVADPIGNTMKTRSS